MKDMGATHNTQGPLDELEVYMEAERLALLATNAIEKAMEHAGLRRAQLACRLDIEKSRVTKVLDGETNLTLRTLAQFGLACGVRWQLVGVDASNASSIDGTPNRPRSRRGTRGEPPTPRKLDSL